MHSRARAKRKLNSECEVADAVQTERNESVTVSMAHTVQGGYGDGSSLEHMARRDGMTTSYMYDDTSEEAKLRNATKKSQTKIEEGDDDGPLDKNKDFQDEKPRK